MMDLDEWDFVAFEDSPNDIEMLEVAGLGVAVGAHPDLKKIAWMATGERIGRVWGEACGGVEEEREN